MQNLITNDLFFICLTCLLYSLFSKLHSKLKLAIINPLFLTASFLIFYIIITNSTSTRLSASLNAVNVFLTPLIVCLSIPVYKRIKIIKQYSIPIVVGTIVGSVVSIAGVYIIGNLVGLDKEILVSILPKSATTPVAVEISARLGGISEVTVFAVIYTGLLGAVAGPSILKFLHIKRSPAVGFSLGGASHSIGTSKAVLISDRVGAISSVAIVTTAILTTIITLFF